LTDLTLYDYVSLSLNIKSKGTNVFVGIVRHGAF